MGQRRTLNQKRLTKKEVQQIIETEGKLHEEFTRFFEEKYVTGHVKQNKVYELHEDRFLFVFDENGLSIRGKGDIYSKNCESYGLDNACGNLYDNLVIYIGEVIRQRVNGHWEINKTYAGGEYPYISVGLERVQYMAVNVVWSAMTGLEEINFRKEAANEVKRNGFDLKFYRGDYNK